MSPEETPTHPDSPPPAKPGQSHIHWPTALQFGLSLLAALSAWGSALSFTLLGMVELFSAQGPSAATPLFLTAIGSLVIGLLLMPSAAHALARLLGREIRLPSGLTPIGCGLSAAAILLVIPVFLLGNWAAGSESFSWLFLPPLHVLGAALPVLWLVWLGGRRLSFGSQQRRWGVLASGLALSPLLIILLEIAVIIAFTFGILVFVGSQPGFAEEFSQMAEGIPPETSDPDILLQELGPIILRPGVLIAVLLFVSVVVPLIEEMFKPIGVWLLVGRRLAPVEGFAAGLLSGAGFALVETLARTTGGLGWLETLAPRIGTNLMHVATAGLMGYALALAWRESRYLRLGAAYLISVVTHGLWNALVVLLSFALLASEMGMDADVFLPSHLTITAPAALVVLSLALLLFLLFANRSLRRQSESAPADIPAENPAETGRD